MQPSSSIMGWQLPLIRGLGTGLFIVAVAACNQANAPNTTNAPPLESPVADSTSDRVAYSEVPLPPAELLVGDDPQQIALSAFGISDPVEGNFKEMIVLIEQGDQAVVNLTQTGLPDDSVEGMRYRLEFVPEGTQWRMDWVGRQVRCRPNRGSQNWTTELCQ